MITVPYGIICLLLPVLLSSDSEKLFAVKFWGEFVGIIDWRSTGGGLFVGRCGGGLRRGCFWLTRGTVLDSIDAKLA